MSLPLRRTYVRPGRLTPAKHRGLRARAVSLPPGGVMPWHSTRQREELLLVLQAAVCVDLVRPGQRIRAQQVQAGQSLWLPAQTIHRVVNTGHRRARYVYVTG